MRKSMERIALTLLAAGAVFSSAFTSLAGWEQSEQGWKYKDDAANVYYVGGWHWIDGNHDGISECYYLNSDGIMAVNTVIDSYTVNADGQWIVDNVIQTQLTSETINKTSVQEGYIKTAIIGCIGKDRAYVESIFGTPNSEGDLEEHITLRYDGFSFWCKKDTGLVNSISARKLSAICNTLNGAEFDWDDSGHESIGEMARGMGEEPQYAGLRPYWPFYVEGHEYWLVYDIGGYLII